MDFTKIFTEEEIIDSNINFELNIAEKLKEEIKEIDSFLEFIFENNTDCLKIKRSVKSENVLNESLTPMSLFDLGEENGVEPEMVLKYGLIDLSYKAISGKKVNWIQWEIKSVFNNGSIFKIILNPYLINLYSEGSDGTDDDKRININICSNELFKKWDNFLSEHIIHKKKRKIDIFMNNATKNLGIDRKFKINKLLYK